VAKTRKSFTPIQPDLFQQLAEKTALEALTAQDLDIELELMGAVTHAIREAKKTGHSRERIVERMNLCLPDADERITLRQLNAWTAASKEHHQFPARYIPAFCWATQCLQPLLILAQCIGYDLVDHRDQIAAELGNKQVVVARTQREIRQLRGMLGG
jgi:hypothetical protein